MAATPTVFYVSWYCVKALYFKKKKIPFIRASTIMWMGESEPKNDRWISANENGVLVKL